MTIHKSPPILWAWLVCFGCAAVLLLFCSGTSPLYNGHDWTDANTYLTMGRGLLHGVVPYRDLFDHKGPLLYFVYALGALLSPSGFFGIYLLQAAALGTALFFLYQTALLVLEDSARAAVCTAALPIFLLTWTTAEAAPRSSASPCWRPPCGCPPGVSSGDIGAGAPCWPWACWQAVSA